MDKRSRLFPRRLDVERGHVDLTHGAGGRATAQLVDELFAAAFDNAMLARRDDQAVFDAPPGRLVLTTDSYVVSPLFFPGGDIGELAVNGTVNDIAMAGARPLYLSAGFILEEGFPLKDLARVVASMARAAREAGVSIVTGDTKVVERGKGDGVFINTTGFGYVPPGVVAPTGSGAEPGDAILVSGTMGDHGIAILTARESLSFESQLASDTAPLHKLVAAMTEVAPSLHVLRDPTRGGLAATLNEIAHQSQVGMRVREADVPVRREVAAACEILGIDPLFAANEGKLVCICAPRDADVLLDVMRALPLGRAAARIGTVEADPDGFVQLETRFGGTRILEWPLAEQLPRIC